MSGIISEIFENSIAQELGLEKGDEIISINKNIPIDLIDYKFLINDEFINLKIKKKNGEFEEIEIEKDFDEDLGIIFECAVFDKIKPCLNKCIFCFVDQQPKGLRKSLYIKDDDYRLSFLQGTYVTLTNLTEKDKKRIETLHLGPLFVSVHTTNPDLRVKMLRNPKASEIMENLSWLNKNNIPFHAQIVLCPDFNDKNELKRTLCDLKKFKRNLLSVAIVPVGITKFRKEKLKQIDEKSALETIKIVEDFNVEMKKQICCCSDEFFLCAKKEIPSTKYYNNFSQIEDGVGAIRLLKDSFKKLKKTLPKKIKTAKILHFINSQSVEVIFKDILSELNKIENLECKQLCIKSEFWGKDINVAGLLVGKDIINQLSTKKSEIENLILSSVMLKPFSTEFLDGTTIEDVEKALDCKIFVIKNSYSLEELNAII